MIRFTSAAAAALFISAPCFVLADSKDELTPTVAAPRGGLADTHFAGV